MRKTIFKLVIIIAVTILILIGIMYLIDWNRMKKGKEVVFGTWGEKYAPVQNKDENEEKNSIKYSKYIDDIKLELDIPNEWKYEELLKNEGNDFFKYALKLYKNNKEKYAMLYFYNNQFGVCGTGRTTEKLILNNSQEAIIGYYDNSKVLQDISFSINKNIALVNNGLNYDDAEELLEIIKTVNITYNSIPDFEILFYDQDPTESYKVYTILDKSETDKYDYNIYGYNGIVNIKIDGNEYSLKEALLENKITMEEIIGKADKDEKDGKITAEMYKDGGSMEYYYDNYTIIKFATLSGNRDVYIGTKDLRLTDIP